jgi:type IV pilus assembly protein PilC
LSYVEIFALQKEIMRLPQYQDMIDDVMEWLQRGESIFEHMQYHTEIIPQDVLVLLKVWEETATLKESLLNINEMYEEELQNTINNVSKLIEPILIVFVWGIIAMIALSVFGVIGNVLDALPAF